MRGNGISQWEYVYFSSTAHDFQICNERNWKLYRSIDEDEYETLDKCADFWIQNKSHAAFVHFFIEKGIFPNELFTDYLDNYIWEFKDKYKCKNIHWTKLHIMKKEHWLSPDVESDKLMEQKYCYKNDYVSRLCKKRYVCTSKFREKSEKQTYSVPERETIVQLGIYFNLDSKSVDLLFSAAGLRCEKMLNEDGVYGDISILHGARNDIVSCSYSENFAVKVVFGPIPFADVCKKLKRVDTKSLSKLNDEVADVKFFTKEDGVYARKYINRRITEEELRSVLSELIGYFDDDKKRR